MPARDASADAFERPARPPGHSSRGQGRGGWARWLVAGLAFALVVGSVLNVGSAQGTVSERYKKFTIYNPERGAPRDRVIIVFHGFASAIPNGAYKRLYEAFSDRYTVVGFNYDYFDIEANVEAFARAWDEVLDDKEVVAAGTSLGGFWANHFAGRFGIDRVLLVNPVTEPVEQLQQFVGRHYVEKRGEEIEVTREDIARYATLVTRSHPETSRLVLLTRDDAVLDYRLAEARFSADPNNLVVVYEDGGGHTLNLREPRFLDRIRPFLD